MQPRYHLRCLGQPALFAPNGELIRFRTKKHLALLVYLVVDGQRTHRRDRLAEFLWPKARTPEARHSLATALSILRPRIGIDALHATRDNVSIDPDRLTLDLDRLRSMDVLGSETTGLLEVSPFLENFDIPDAPEFALWKDRQQASLLPMIKDALIVLIHQCRRTGNSRQIEQLADRMLVLDDLSEEAVRAKMEARALAGDRLTALKVFEDWKTRLYQELRAAPSLEVEQMAARMRRGGWERTVINDIPTQPPAHGRARAFIGRTQEYAFLYETWGQLKRGTGVHCLILGDSGVGKSTLVERLTTAASLEGASVSRVQSYDLERNIPFAALGGLITGLLERPGALATPPEALAELGRVAPEVRRRFPTLPTPDDAQGETARINLTESFHQLLRSVSEEHPVILVIDDLHLADEPSLAVLHLVLRRAAGEAMLALFIGRPGEIGESTQAALLRESLGRAGGQEVHLSPLTEAQSLDLLISLLQAGETPPSATEQRSLARASGGYPMVLELLVQDWRTHGSKSVAFGLNAMTADFVAGEEPRAAYGKILSRLANSLEHGAKSALDLASVLGHRLNDLPMYSIIDLSLGQTMAALAQLSEMRVLREGSVGLEFSNELIRAHAYSAIPSPVRKALHASVADRIRNRSGTDEPGSQLEIAWHTMRAGRTNEAIPYLLEGAREAIRCGAPQSAERALSSAIVALKGGDLIDARLLLVEALQEQGRWRDSLDACRMLEGLVGEDRAQEAFALAALAKAYLGASVSLELFEFLPSLKNIMRSCHHRSSRIRAARAAAQAIAPLRDRRLGLELLEILQDIPTNDLDPDSQGQLCLARAMFLYQAGLTEESFMEASSGLDFMRRRGSASATALQLQTGLGVTRSLQGRYQESALHYERAMRMADSLGNDSLAGRIAANLALTYGRLGRYDDQLRCAEQAPRDIVGESAPWRDIQLTFSIAYVHGLNGRVSKALNAIEDLEARLPSDLSSSFRQRWLLWKADALVISGLKSEAIQAAAMAVCDYQLKLEASAFAGPFARWVAVVCVGNEMEIRAREVLNDLEQNLFDYDVIDRLEILCANASLNRADAHRYRSRVAELLKLLPECTESQLRALGMNLDI